MGRQTHPAIGTCADCSVSDWVGGVIFLRFYEVKTINNLIFVEEKTLIVERKKKLSLNPFLYFPKRIYT